MMKKITKLLTGLFLLAAVGGVKAQANQDCNVKYNLFKGNVTTKKYTEARPELDYLIANCPTLSVNIYKYGATIASKTGDHALAKKVYETRLANYPKKGAAKAHSDYATYLVKNKLATDAEVFTILDTAYKISPKDMSVKNIYKYFEGVLEANKETNVQKVFDTYDDVVESVGEKLEDYQKKIIPLLEQDSLGTISAKDKRRLKAYTTNSKALGTVEGGLDAKIAPLVTCERLIPIYKKDYEANKTNGVWLKRSVSRMYSKGCQSDPLYATLVKSYADVTQSSDAYNFYASVLEKNEDASGAAAMRAKAFDLETDPNVKAKFKLRQAQSKGGSKGRALAYEALKYNPNLGKAYLYIASLYAKSANSCGSDVFEKKMVFVAALNKAKRAQSVDPGCGAGRYIRSYQGNIPNKKEIFTKGVAPGSSHKVACWIGETVRVPK